MICWIVLFYIQPPLPFPKNWLAWTWKPKTQKSLWGALRLCPGIEVVCFDGSSSRFHSRDWRSLFHSRKQPIAWSLIKYLAEHFHTFLSIRSLATLDNGVFTCSYRGSRQSQSCPYFGLLEFLHLCGQVRKIVSRLQRSNKGIQRQACVRCFAHPRLYSILIFSILQLYTFCFNNYDRNGLKGKNEQMFFVVIWAFMFLASFLLIFRGSLYFKCTIQFWIHISPF